jgi:tryptophanyl-tRNA synthetase
MENKEALERELRTGEEKARAVASKTMQRVREKLGYT